MPATCGTSGVPPDPYQSTNIDGKFITMKTDFVWYTPFCENYTNALVNSNAPSVQYTGNYNLNEDFVLSPNQNVIFQNCSLAIAAGKQIRVQAGAQLILNNCVLFSCGAMWQGIINEGGVVTITATPNSIAKISDAVEAIRSDNGFEVDATSVIFSNNYVGISLNEGNYSTSDIIGCSFNPTSASEILKIPYNQTRTFAGIQLNSVSEFQLGSLTSTVFNPRNIFQYANYGVYSLNSDITFESNLFTDLMPGIDHCIDCGTGIYSEVNDGMTHSILIAGGTGSVTKNNFNVDVSHGIISNGPINLTITECIFNGNNYNSIKITKNRNSIVSIENNDFLNAGEKGISMYSNASCDFNILNNRFTNVITGIFAQNYAKCDVKIGDNILTTQASQMFLTPASTIQP
ncbi:MAG: right-handed parallel beta-helix repeat-containing protein [Bacteroidetes bacterium]|nr:right-handed parallel beta-helix repeat-containing protein [Bacteroidota bacterium]